MTASAIARKAPPEPAAPISLREQIELKRAEVIADIDRRRVEANLRAAQLQHTQVARRRAEQLASFSGSSDVASRGIAEIDQELRTLMHVTLPALDREFESINGGCHPQLASLNQLLATVTAQETRVGYEGALSDFQRVLTPELIEAAKRVVAESSKLLITPANIALVVSQHAI